MPLREARLAREIFFRVEQVYSRHAGIVRHIELAPCQQFIQIPGAARGNSGRRRFHKILYNLRVDGVKNTL